MKIGSLFSGIGGLELGLERAGVGRTVWQCEIDPYARAVLAKHWPDAIRFEDITQMHDVPPVDLICGGFPCQDISNAGKRVGIEGARSGLFFELMRVVRLVRPRFVVLENVAALLGRGMGDVLGELSESGYDAEWSTISACALGAPHTRDRLFILAESVRGRQSGTDASDEIRRNEKRQPSPRFGGRRDISTAFESIGQAALRLGQDVEPGVVGTLDDFPGWMERRRCLGNAVVPQVAEVVGRRVLELMAGVQPELFA